MSLSLLLIVDRSLPDPFGFSSEVDFDNTTLYINSNGVLISLSIRTFAKYCRSQDITLLESVRETFGSVQKIISEIDNQIGQNLREILLADKQKLDLNILLNSPGGHNFSLKSILDIIKFTKQKGGIVTTFSFIIVASAASYIHSFTDRRYCLKLTEFMCHASGTIPELEYLLEDNTEEENEISEEITYDEYEEHLNKFFEMHSTSSKKRIDEIIQKALEKSTCELYLAGYNLEDFGVVQKAYYDFRDIIKLVGQKIGKKIMKDKRVLSFCEKMKLEYQLVLDDNSKYSEKLPRLKCYH